MKRGLFDIILFLSLFILPWWVGGIMAIIGIFLFNNFYEFIISGVIIYSLYTIVGSGIFSSSIFFSALIIISYIIIQFIRSRIIIYNKNEFSY